MIYPIFVYKDKDRIVLNKLKKELAIWETIIRINMDISLWRFTHEKVSDLRGNLYLRAIYHLKRDLCESKIQRISID